MSSVARSLRGGIEEAFAVVPDVVWLIIAVAIIAYFIRPTLDVVGMIRNFISGGTTSTLTTTGTVGSVHSRGQGESYYDYAQPYIPIKRFFRQMVAERQV
jgi:hypothetical protein